MTTTRASLRRVAEEAARRPRDRDGHAIRDTRTPNQKAMVIAEGLPKCGSPEGREPGSDEIGTRRTIVIERVSPEIDGGRYPAKRVVGDELLVTADIVADGHDLLDAVLLLRSEHETGWREVPMRLIEN